jgi:hypothetical protein
MHSMVTKINQRIHILSGNQINATAITGIAAVRAAHGNIFFTPKTDCAITAIARLYTYFCFVNKSHNLHTLHSNLTDKNKKSPAI